VAIVFVVMLSMMSSVYTKTSPTESVTVTSTITRLVSIETTPSVDDE